MDQQHSAPDKLTVAEVCARLHVNKYTVYRLIHSGELPAVRGAGRNKFLIDVDELTAWQSGDHLASAAAGPDDPFLTAAEVAVRLRCSRDTVRRLVAEGHLRAHRLGGRASHLRIPTSAVAEYLAARATTAAPALAPATA